MASAVENFCKFQAESSSSNSISFGRFEAESLSWERKSSFSRNRYLDEVEKYSSPGSVIEKKAYFEAHFKKTALRNLIAIERQTIIAREIKDTSIGVQISITGSPNDAKRDIMETASSLEFEIEKEPRKYVETAKGKKTNSSAKSSAVEKTHLSNLKRTTKASHMDKWTIEHGARISSIGGTVSKAEKKFSSVSVYSSSRSTGAKASKKLEKETTITVRHSSSRLSSSTSVGSRNMMKLEVSNKTIDKTRVETRSSSRVDQKLIQSDSVKKGSSCGHGSTLRDKQLTTTMKLSSRTSTQVLSLKCNEGIEQTKVDGKVKAKPPIKPQSLEAPSMSYISHKPNPQQLYGKKPSRPNKAVDPVKRGDEVKTTTRKTIQGDGTIKTRSNRTISKGLIS